MNNDSEKIEFEILLWIENFVNNEGYLANHFEEGKSRLEIANILFINSFD